MILKDILNEMSPSEKDKHCMIPFMRYLRVVKLIETEKYTEMSERQKQWLPGAGRGGG